MSTLAHLGAQLEVTLSGHKVPSPEAEKEDWFVEKLGLPYTAKTWNEIYNLLDRPWFRRLWVMQEIGPANRLAILQCGNDVIPWSIFRRAVTCLYSKNSLPRDGLRNLALECVRLAEDHRGKTLMLLLEHSRLQLCSDPKDKLYGLLGMVPARLAEQIHPNYSPDVGVEETYKTSFLAHINHVRRWELFSCELAYRKIGGPTWVPDWTASVPTGMWGSRQQLSSGHSRMHFTYHQPHILDVTGLQYATVRTVSDPVVSRLPGKDLKTVRSWEPKDLYDRGYVTGDSLLDAYAITLLQNRTRDRWPRNIYLPALEAWKSQNQTPALFGELVKSTRPDDQFDSSFSLMNRAYNCVLGRAYVTTDEGYIGLVPTGTKSGRTFTSNPIIQVPDAIRFSQIPMASSLEPLTDCLSSSFRVHYQTAGLVFDRFQILLQSMAKTTSSVLLVECVLMMVD
ncbi:hypothetical protein BKA66DRAFT_576415 [Pyrenochaeta sp. MPI-SDFR-AT-0127]|nr:hypothetical protein BKA66DRAFT_576415 [Pyrenochaeta sp. MPI-SDFR-AT-0127]